MFYNRFDSYYYSRPIAYRSYYPRVSKQELLPFDDSETKDVLAFLRNQGLEVDNRGTLHRGILFKDIEVGKRQYNHNNYRVSTEYYIHQQKPTNDLADWHPTGTHLVFKSFPEFMKKLTEVVQEQKKRY